MKKLIVVIVMTLPLLAASAEDTNTFHSVTAGFQIEKPEGWRFASLEQVSRNRATARLKDEELQKLIREDASAPLVAIVRHDEPYDSLNPSFQVILRPIPPSLQGSTPRQILEVILPTLESGFQDFKLEAPIHEFELSGLAAAELTAQYTVSNPEGRVFPTRATMIVVPRGEFMFLMSASAPPEGPDASREEFEALVGSIQIAD